MKSYYLSWLLLPFFVSCVLKRNLNISEHYRYGVLTDSYGLLSDDDIWISEQRATPRPFSEDSISYTYWQCFESESGNVKISCEDLGYNKIEKSHPAFLGIDVTSKQGTDSYSSGQVLPISDCNKELLRIKRMIAGEKYICLSGSYVSLNDMSQKQDRVPRKREWIYDRLKTKTECTSWAKDYCEVKYWQLQETDR